MVGRGVFAEAVVIVIVNGAWLVVAMEIVGNGLPRESVTDDKRMMRRFQLWQT